MNDFNRGYLPPGSCVTEILHEAALCAMAVWHPMRFIIYENGSIHLRDVSSENHISKEEWNIRVSPSFSPHLIVL
ncbi:hypothetical protein BDR22DRAFT_862665 [Usnea florida]